MAPILFLIVNFGTAIVAGYLGSSVLWPIVAAFVVAFQNVGSGWRAGSAGKFGSMMIGAVFSMIVALPLFFLVRWLAT